MVFVLLIAAVSAVLIHCPVSVTVKAEPLHLPGVWTSLFTSQLPEKRILFVQPPGVLMRPRLAASCWPCLPALVHSPGSPPGAGHRLDASGGKPAVLLIPSSLRTGLRPNSRGCFQQGSGFHVNGNSLTSHLTLETGEL